MLLRFVRWGVAWGPLLFFLTFLAFTSPPTGKKRVLYVPKFPLTAGNGFTKRSKLQISMSISYCILSGKPFALLIFCPLTPLKNCCTTPIYFFFLYIFVVLSYIRLRVRSFYIIYANLVYKNRTHSRRRNILNDLLILDNSNIMIRIDCLYLSQTQYLFLILRKPLSWLCLCVY